MRQKPTHCAECGEPIKEIYRSPYFCAECDRERIARIGKQIDSIARAFGLDPESY